MFLPAYSLKDRKNNSGVPIMQNFFFFSLFVCFALMEPIIFYFLCFFSDKVRKLTPIPGNTFFSCLLPLLVWFYIYITEVVGGYYVA